MPDAKQFAIGEVIARKLVFKWRWNKSLVLDSRPDEERWADPSHHEEYRATELYVDDSWESGRWFAFWNEDCFQPSVYVIRAESFETAYEVFIEEFGAKACGTIEPGDDVSNYGDGATVDSLLESGVLTWTANGIIDTEAVKGEEITLVSASMA